MIVTCACFQDASFCGKIIPILNIFDLRSSHVFPTADVPETNARSIKESVPRQEGAETQKSIAKLVVLSLEELWGATDQLLPFSSGTAWRRLDYRGSQDISQVRHQSLQIIKSREFVISYPPLALAVFATAG